MSTFWNAKNVGRKSYMKRAYKTDANGESVRTKKKEAHKPTSFKGHSKYIG